MLWQYRTILFEFTKDGLLGDKYVDDEEMEKTLNQLGEHSWELVNVSLLQDGLLAFLKRPGEKEVAVEQPLAVEPIKPPPVLEPRPPVSVRNVVAAEQIQAEEREPRHSPEPPRKNIPQQEDTDFVGGIKIS